MIKIIISGTYDGYYPRFSSDGVLEDVVTRQLLDRNMLFSTAENHLFCEGYSFQLVERKGIFYHKIIQLFDAAGRDGFMMASLYLPDGEKLKGAEIKEALDAIIREYKMHIVGGMANVELDWSFVKRKADEVNTKVKVEPWRTHPSPAGSSRTALMKGAENRIAEYFEYPNPMHDGFSGYEQVFLTERLLDPALGSSDGVQGYKVLTKDDVDIDNPTYVIDYVNPNGYSTMGLKHKVTKKELAVPGSFLCGELSKDGYRKRNVIIPEGKKQSEDGETIKVELPTLVPKQASVLLKVVDSKTGKEIPWGNYSVSWKGGQYYDSDWGFRPSQSALFSFETVDCDQQWKVRVECDQYEGSETTVTVEDGKKEISVHVTLRYNPTWTIVVTHPDRTKSENINVPQDKKNGKIFELRSSLESEGLEVKTMPEDRDSRLVSLIATYPRWTIKIIYSSQNISEKKEVPQNELEKAIEALKKEYEGKGLEFDKRDESARIVKLYFVKRKQTEVSGDTGEHSRRENVFKDSSRNANKTDSTTEPEKKKWVLSLDEKSKQYSIFKNCKKKSELESEVKADLARLKSSFEEFSNSFKKVGGDSKTVKYVKEQIGLVIEELPKGKRTNLERAKEAFDNARNKLKNKSISDNPAVEELVGCAKDAIKTYREYLSIPSAIVEPLNVYYDQDEHRLVAEQELKPSSKPKFGKDHYSYSFKKKSLNWADESVFYATKDKHEVVRRLQPKYKFLWFVLPLLVIGGAGASWYFWFRPTVNEEIVNLKKSLEVAIDSLNKYEKYYCDDALYNDYYGLPISYNTIKNKNEKKTGSQEMRKLDSVYGVFAGLFEDQKEFKKQDASIYAELKFLNDSISTWGINRVKFENLQQGDNFKKTIAPMSNSHKKEVEEWYNERLKETPKSSNGNTPGGIVDHQNIIDGPNRLYNNFLKNYEDVKGNKLENYSFSFSNTYKYCEGLRDSIVLAVRSKSITRERYNECYRSVTNYNGKERIEKLNNMLWEKETQIVSSDAGFQTLNPPSGGIKVKVVLERKDVFPKLTWNNVNDNGQAFWGTFDISDPKLYNEIDCIIDKANNMKASEYNEVHNRAKSAKTNAADRLVELYYLLGCNN